MDPAFRATLEQVYAEHPFSATAILDRIRLEQGSLNGVSARDLAVAPNGGPTDQNHIGGALVVRQLADLANLQETHHVLDIGAGLGGTLRLLAEDRGCSGHGVELTTSRYRDAIRLTQLVHLDHLVTFTHGDFMTVALAQSPFDLAIAQGTLMHFSDLPATLTRVRASVRRDGMFVIEDGVLLRRPASQDERHRLEMLQQHWHGSFQPVDDWPELVQRAGFEMNLIDDMRDQGERDFEDWLAADSRGTLQGASAEERSGWQLGLDLLRSGYLGMARIVATAR